MKKIIAVFAVFMLLQVSVNAAETQTSSGLFSKLGRILKIVTEDETTTNENEKSGLKKVSDYLNSAEQTTTTAADKVNSKINDIQELQKAIKNNDLATVAKLLTKDNVNTKTSNGLSLLSLAVANDNADIVTALLKAGADINEKNSTGDTELSVAAALGNVNALKALINNGADITTANNKGWTPLHAAVAADKKASVQLLIAAGADVNAASPQGITPLTLATVMKRTEIKDILVKAGATYVK